MDLSKLVPGLEGHAEIIVGEELTAPRIGSGRVRVLATPVMINLMEAAALDAVENLIPAGHQSLGTHLDAAGHAHHIGVSQQLIAQVTGQLETADLVLDRRRRHRLVDRLDPVNVDAERACDCAGARGIY